MRVVIFLFVAAILLSCNNEQAAQTATETQDSVNSRANDAAMAKRLGDPNSPYRSEDEYIKLLQKQLQSRWYGAAEKEVIQKQLTLILKNRVGEAANDFEFLQPDGKKEKLYAVKADYVLLFFYNPECEACKETKAALIASAIITDKLKAGKLKLLAIYTDKDETIWRKHLPDMPNAWVHGRDEDEYLWKNKLYDLRAIPTVYLLDKHKNVLLKDCQDIKAIEKIVSGEVVK